MKELTFAIAETQKRRLGFFGRPVQKCRLGKIRKEIEREEDAGEYDEEYHEFDLLGDDDHHHDHEEDDEDPRYKAMAASKAEGDDEEMDVS